MERKPSGKVRRFREKKVKFLRRKRKREEKYKRKLERQKLNEMKYFNRQIEICNLDYRESVKGSFKHLGLMLFGFLLLAVVMSYGIIELLLDWVKLDILMVILVILILLLFYTIVTFISIKHKWHYTLAWLLRSCIALVISISGALILLQQAINPSRYYIFYLFAIIFIENSLLILLSHAIARQILCKNAKIQISAQDLHIMESEILSP